MTDCSELSILSFMREMSSRSEAVRRGRFLKGLLSGTPLLAYNVGSIRWQAVFLCWLCLFCFAAGGCVCSGCRIFAFGYNAPVVDCVGRSLYRRLSLIESHPRLWSSIVHRLLRRHRQTSLAGFSLASHKELREYIFAMETTCIGWRVSRFLGKLWVQKSWFSLGQLRSVHFREHAGWSWVQGRISCWKNIWFPQACGSLANSRNIKMLPRNRILSLVLK